MKDAGITLIIITLYKFATTSTGVTVTGAATATTFLGDLNGTINTVTTAVTKANATNDTTVATTAFVQNLIGTIPAGLVFQGTWNAATNTPTLTSGSGTTGNFYIVSTSGSTNLDGVTDWVTGDWAVFIEQGGTDAWEKIDNSSVLDGAGTGNKLTKWSGSGTSNTLTDSIVTDNGNDLDVNGGVTADYFRTDTNSGDYSLISRDSAGNAALYVQQAGTSASQPIAFFSYGSATANQGSKVLAVGKDISYFDNCNVGIGTTAPSAKLHIVDGNNYAKIGDLQADSTMVLQLADTSTQPVEMQAYGSELRLNTATTSGATPSVKMNILANGNVGIGTTSPGASLHVAGAITSAPTGTGVLMGMEGNYATVHLNGASGGIIEFSTSGVDRKGRILYNNSSNHMQIQTNGSERMRIDSSGNVGIGTTSPGAKLHVDGTAIFDTTTGTTPFYITRSGATDQALQIHVDDQNVVFESIQDETADDYGGFIFNMDAGTTEPYFDVRKNNSTIMRVDGGGNVGIGTTAPKTKLDINGHFCVDSKTHSITDTFTTCLTVNLSNHTGCHVVITAFGDWGSHSSAAYRGEFFLQNGANGYSEPGIILRQDDNTSDGTDQIICQIVDPASTANPKDFEIQIRHTDTVVGGFSAQFTYTVQGQFNSIT